LVYSLIGRLNANVGGVFYFASEFEEALPLVLSDTD